MPAIVPIHSVDDVILKPSAFQLHTPERRHPESRAFQRGEGSRAQYFKPRRTPPFVSGDRVKRFESPPKYLRNLMLPTTVPTIPV